MAQQLHSLKVNEVSLVDSPANQEMVDGKRVRRATVAFFKRDLSAQLWDSEDEICKAVDGPDEGVSKDGKTYGGVSYPKGDFAYTPDDEPSHWKLRLTKTPGGKPDSGIVGAAIAALGKGFRGKKVVIPAEALPGVKAKVRSAWKQANPDKGEEEMPDVLKGESTMTLQELEQRVTKAETELAASKTEIATLKADRDASQTETEMVIKMTKKERKAYASMDAEKRKAYMAADKEKRQQMMDAACATQKEKAAEDEMDEATRKRYDAAGPIAKRAMLDEVMKAKAAKGKKDDEEPDDKEPDDDEDDMEKRELKLKIAKGEDRVTALESQLAAITKQNRLEAFTKRAETDLPNTPGTPVEKGAQLMLMADNLPGGEKGEAFKKFMDGQKAADAAYKSHFAEVGKGAGVAAGSALSEFDAEVEKIAKRDKIDTPHAIEKLMMENPEAYLKYEREQRLAVANR